jgi:hypothetical protein
MLTVEEEGPDPPLRRDQLCSAPEQEQSSSVGEMGMHLELEEATLPVLSGVKFLLREVWGLQFSKIGVWPIRGLRIYLGLLL